MRRNAVRRGTVKARPKLWPTAGSAAGTGMIRGASHPLKLAVETSGVTPARAEITGV